MSRSIRRAHYVDMYGPTVGDRVRLGDTALIAEVENDFAVYGDECKFGGGKVLRDRQGQRPGVGDREALDCVITNALVIDASGIYKADIGIKGGRIAGIGKAGNSLVMAGVSPTMIVGAATEADAGEGRIRPPGRHDSPLPFLFPPP